MNKKTLTYVLIGLIAGVAAFFLWSAFGSHGSLNADLYPLYPGAEWGRVKASTVEGAAGSQVVSAPLKNITDIASSSVPFEKYYEDKLTKAGWTLDKAREASGPGSEVSVYTRGNQFIIVSYQTTFQNISTHTPVQCPCDLQFTLISGATQ